MWRHPEARFRNWKKYSRSTKDSIRKMHLAMQAAYGLLNLSATLRPAGGPWKLYAQLKNATNTTALTNMLIASPILLSARSVGYNPPRSFGVGATFDF